ncbi:hypothetical protein PR202_gb13450 [Eleusine coracana subsp. coracana]|uniref:Protein SPIRAL1-like 3 n=1 Tax=Eleusine coracana subsp. coracana TaxID=191504 RepID=A0AAV5EQG9_ELECO|nr:hypothetical protein QOZ80_9BG0714940 [Eleusine coracana subsp. coracana]GJN25603.1 hypothetical protein PR202_gb13450 [Eleusine coracana subsp. coracana]
MGRGRGVSYGGGQSSLDYLFGGGGGEAKQPAASSEQRPRDTVVVTEAAAAPPISKEGNKMKEIPAGVRGSQANNYFRAQGQNCGNFLTDRPSTKVHAAPGGGSSLDYLFGGGGK